MKIVLPLFVLLAAAPVFAVPLTVSVVDDKGQPVAGADVQFESFAKTPRGFVVQQTNEQGTTTFEAEPQPFGPLRDIAARVFARKQGLSIGNGMLHFKTPALRIELDAATKVGGTVVDSEGKPIPNADIAFLEADQEGKRGDMLTDGPLKTQMTVHSGADGSWQLDGVPVGSQVYVTVSAPLLVSTRTKITADGTGQTTLRPGSQIKGRLLGLDGKPLPGIYVSARSTNGSLNISGGGATTGADGTFVIAGIEPSNYNVSFYLDGEKPFVVPALQNVRATVGETTQLSDARAIEGVLLSGHVLEKGTKAPISGVQLSIAGGTDAVSSATESYVTTDEKGAWNARTVPGQTRIYAQYVPAQFKQDQREKTSTVGEAGATDLNFEMERLPQIAGRLLDEEGKGIKAYIQLRRDNEVFEGSSDENGALTVYGPAGGDWTVSAVGNWELASPAHLTIAPDKPLEVRLKRPHLSTLELGVYDDDDVAVEGASVTVNLLTGDGEGQAVQPVELISDKTGRAHFDSVRPEQRVEIASVTKSGYDTTPPPKPDHVGQVWSASLTLLKRSGHASGQVFGANGEAAPGVRVAGSGLDTRTDDAGHFDLAPLPKGITPVFAWQGEVFALGTSDQTRLDLKPQPLEPTDPAKAKAILDALADQAKGVEYYTRDSLQFEVGSFDEIAEKLKQKPLPYGVSMLLTRFGNDQTIPASRWFDVMQSAISPLSRLSNLKAWLKTSPTIPADDEAHRFLQLLQKDVAEVEPQFKSDDKWMIGDGIFAAAAFAEKIGETQAADDLFERARAFTEKAYGRESDRTYGNIGEIVAVSPRFLLKTAALLPDTNSNRSLVLGQGTPLLARIVGLEAVKPFLLQLQNAPTPKPDSYGDTFSTEAQWHEATINSIRAAGKDNPTLALELAKALPLKTGFSDYDARDTALCEAAFFQSPDAAHELWSDALPRLDPAKAMSFVARILERDEPFARAQYETLARDMDARPLPQYNSTYVERTTDLAAFVFYEARFNPARAHFRLERAYAYTLAQSGQGTGDALASYAKVMAIFDANRAVGWTARIPGAINDWSGSFETRRRIAQWIALGEKARQQAQFARPYSQDWGF